MAILYKKPVVLQSGGKVVSFSGDPWEYKKEGDSYLTRKKGSNDWIVAQGKSREAIKKEVFKDNKTETGLKSDYSGKSFNDAFKTAYKAGGEGSVFVWNGKNYKVDFANQKTKPDNIAPEITTTTASNNDLTTSFSEITPSKVASIQPTEKENAYPIKDSLLERVVEMMTSVQNEGIINTAKQVGNFIVPEKTKDIIVPTEGGIPTFTPIAQELYEKNTRPITPTKNLNNRLVPHNEFDLNGMKTSSFSVENVNSVSFRNRGENRDTQGQPLFYTYSPFDTYDNHIKRGRYAGIVVSEDKKNLARDYDVLSIKDGKITSGKMSEFKDTDTPISPTYKVSNVEELIISPNNKFNSGINQRELGIKTKGGGVTYMPIGIGEDNSGDVMSNWSGGHLVVENPTTKEMTVLHGSAKQLKAGVEKFKELHGIDNVNIYETDHKAYAILKYGDDKKLSKEFNADRDNINSYMSGSGNYVYLNPQDKIPYRLDDGFNSSDPTIIQTKNGNKESIASNMADELVKEDKTSNTVPRNIAFAESTRDFAKQQYNISGVKHGKYFIVDKPTQSIFSVDVDSGATTLLGRVGIGAVVGDRDVSKGRKSGTNTNQTQAGWVRINRQQPYKQRSYDYGDQFNGFEALVGSEWKEVPTGIHGTENIPAGRVSHGCTRLSCELEKELAPYLTKNTLIFYTSDNKKLKNGGKLHSYSGILIKK